jgi:putative membrane protein
MRSHLQRGSWNLCGVRGRIISLGLAFIMPCIVSAHEVQAPETAQQLAYDWEFDPVVIVALLVTGFLYVKGVHKLWQVVGSGKAIKKWEAGSFAAGWLAAVIALVSPLHAWGRALFSAHMTQHEVLMLVTAPLLVLGRPMLAFLKAMPAQTARRLARVGNSLSWQKIWHALTYPLTAWLIHALALWLWHIPFLFQATLKNDFVHSLQHSSFLFSALMFWWALIHGRQRMMGYGIAVLYVFTTAMHSGLLGALITFAETTLYPEYQNTSVYWGLSPLEDQRLGGLIMWVPAGLVYVVAGLALFAGWLRESEYRISVYEKELRREGLGKGSSI